MTDSSLSPDPGAEPPFPADVAFLIELFVLFCGFYFFCFTLTSFPLFRPFDWLGTFFLFEMPVLLLAGWLLGVFQRARILLFPSLFRRAGALLAFVIMPVLLAGFWFNVAVFFLNGTFDRSTETQEIRVLVSQTQTDKGPGGQSCSVLVQIPYEEQGPFLGYWKKDDLFPVECRSFAYLHEGSTGGFSMRPGALGIRWIEHYNVSFDIGKTEIPLDGYGAFWLRRLGFGWLRP